MSDGPVPGHLELVREAWPPVAGRPGLTQGRYGAAVGAWSGALKFASGHQYVSADVTQVDAGPDFLEVVALTTDGTVRRHVWSPGPGFVDHGELAHSAVSCSGVVQSPADGSLHVAVTGHDSRVRVLVSTPASSYPVLTFTEAPPEVAVPLVAVRDQPDLGSADSLAAAGVRVGGRDECHVVERRGEELWHHTALSSGALARTEGRLVEARIWR